jgi:hypothetical protein
VAKGVIAAGAALLVLGGGALGYALTRHAVGGLAPQKIEVMSAAVASLDGDIKAARASVDQRATTLAEVASIRAAVATDAGTAADMAGREIAFKPAKGEVIELGQNPKPSGASISLLVLPQGGMRSSKSGVVGGSAELQGDQLLVTKTVDVVPSDPEAAKQLNGFVTVSQVLDLKPAIAKIEAEGLTATIEVGGNKRAIGAPAPEGSTTQTMAIPSQPGAQVTVAVPPIKGGMPIPVAAVGGGAAGLGLILLLIGMIGGKDKTGLTRMMPAQQLTQQPFAGTTNVSGPGVAAGTPSPVDVISGPSLPGGQIGAGAVVGRWEVVRRLGSGGMADVYLAQARGEAGFQKLVAIKIMHGHLARNTRAVEHFLDEARLAARVVHPNVVGIQDLGKIGDDYVIVMDYVEGVDLERLLANARIAGRQVPLNVALGVLCRICDGLNAAHKAVQPDGTPIGIIHRDVKSANVLVSKQGGVKVVDFGIAKAATQSHMTVAGETKGTPSMMAPEQRVGELVDVRADVYSLGAVAFEVLTGHAVNLDLAALAHLGVENWPHLPPPSSLRPELPRELDPIVLTAMAFERERRPADCVAFEAQFETVMKQYNLSASDKDIARWVEFEMRDLALQAAPEGTAATALT